MAPSKLGLVLSGGGARSAYQAGVMVGLHELAQREGLEAELKFPIFSGISGGAINSVYLASHAEDWSIAVDGLWRHWENLTMDSVVKSGSFPLLKRAARVAMQLGMGGRTLTGKKSSELLSSEPLRKLLCQNSNFERLQKNIDRGTVHALGLTATQYGTGTSVTFYQGPESIRPWVRRNRIGRPERLTVEHALASSAIPFLFAPVNLHGSFYGDGALRMSSPLSPAIHMGADRLLAIGVRYARPESEVVQQSQQNRTPTITLADIAGASLNALFLDAVDSDVERLERINRTLSAMPVGVAHPESLRQIPVLTIRPSADIGQMARGQINRFSWTLRHLLQGLGSSEQRGSDLISYLAFDRSYTTQLLDLGRRDALAQKAAVFEWLGK
ncbi:MAG TPA: patatin-like phospholipase family protein [Bdellovibrionota bacterium]|jgi:NTE family protein|nr:patatin-like phospholipase family protein [Bdellovibrionota bacterium]